MVNLALVLTICVGPSLSNNDEFSDDRAKPRFVLSGGDLTLSIKGELELELHDLQGAGGTGFDSSTDTQTLGTRSPFVEIDTFWLALRLELMPGLSLLSILEFSPTRAGVRAAWFDYRLAGPSWWRHHLELGIHTPIIKVERRTERYPLIASAFWRRPESHLAYEGRLTLAPQVSLLVSASVAIMRPLTVESVAESTSQTTTVNVVAFGQAKPFSGNGPITGGSLGLSFYGVSLTAFGFVGKLSKAEGSDQLRAIVTRYRDLAGDDTGDSACANFWGGRLEYHEYNVHVIAEFIASELERYKRWGAYGQVSYLVHLRGGRYLTELEPLVRLETYRVLRSKRIFATGRALRASSPIFATAWDYDVLTAAVRLSVIDQVLNLRVEYYWVKEHNAVPQLALTNQPLANNELLVQLETRF